jgi:hexosaminidase
MAYAKLNTLHLHITDAQNFPLEVPAVPGLTNGYEPQAFNTYSQQDMRDLVAYAKVHAVRIVPEIDTPAHSTSWVGLRGEYAANLACANAEPWTEYCEEPPCGQLNPLPSMHGVNQTYDILRRVIENVTGLFPDVGV